jgi:hypothetical protein
VVGSPQLSVDRPADIGRPEIDENDVSLSVLRGIKDAFAAFMLHDGDFAKNCSGCDASDNGVTFTAYYFCFDCVIHGI